MKLKTLIITGALSALFSIQALAGWVDAGNGQWTYEQDGTTLTSQWIQDESKWYYVGPDGIMLASTSQTIDGVDYTFDASGRWQEPDRRETGVNAGLYQNAAFRYSLRIPADLSYTLEDNGDLSIGSGTTLINIGHITYTTADVDVSERAQTYVENFKTDTANEFPFQYTTEVQLGEVTFTRHHFYSAYYNASVDLYISTQENGFMSIFTGYVPSTEPTVQNILKTIKKLS